MALGRPASIKDNLRRNRPARRVGAGARLSLMHVTLIVGAVLMIYPLLWLASSSLKQADAIFSDPANLIPHPLTVSNYPAGWTALPVPFSTFLINSALLAVLAVVGNLISCSLTAYAFAKLHFALRRLWFVLMLGTIMLPTQVTLVPQYLLFHQLHWIDTYLPLVIPQFLATNAFFVFLITQFMRGIPRDLSDAATVDGCGELRTYWHIILPLSRAALISTAVLSFIWTWDEFLQPLVYLSSIGKYTIPLALNLFLGAQGQTSYGAMFAMSVVALAPVVVCFMVFQKQIVEGVSTTGLKG